MIKLNENSGFQVKKKKKNVSEQERNKGLVKGQRRTKTG